MKNKQVKLRRNKRDMEIDSELEKATLDDFDLSKAKVYYPNPDFKTTVQTSIRLAKPDIELAKVIGNMKGVKYQTLIKMYIREGIVRDSRLVLKTQ